MLYDQALWCCLILVADHIVEKGMIDVVGFEFDV